MLSHHLKTLFVSLFLFTLTACAPPAKPTKPATKIDLSLATKPPQNNNDPIKVEKKVNGGPHPDSAHVNEIKKIMQSNFNSQQTYETKKRAADPNAFYRFKLEQAQKRPLIDDGVHDPTADLTDLQPPIEAFKNLPSATFGNGINWVEALHEHKINPRADQLGEKEQFTLEMNIVMPVKGTMNDILFPHKIHTELLACRNCHTGIFQMKTGANPITMKKINKGQYCGVCHGKVAFPIANCNRCHSVAKKINAGKR